mgnify:CR=1 FL=1|tara:strand:- start:238 stop:879 length:642 start_codon:yes stop_codon:yes gene_type:complete
MNKLKSRRNLKRNRRTKRKIYGKGPAPSTLKAITEYFDLSSKGDIEQGKKSPKIKIPSPSVNEIDMMERGQSPVAFRPITPTSPINRGMNSKGHSYSSLSSIASDEELARLRNPDTLFSPNKFKNPQDYYGEGDLLNPLPKHNRRPSTPLRPASAPPLGYNSEKTRYNSEKTLREYLERLPTDPLTTDTLGGKKRRKTKRKNKKKRKTRKNNY